MLTTSIIFNPIKCNFFGCLLILQLFFGYFNYSLSLNSDIKDTVYIQLPNYPDYQLIGFYVAKHNGFYSDQGIEVLFNKAENNTNIVHNVVAGSFDYGVWNSSLVKSKLEGQPIVLISAFIQNSVIKIISLEKANIFSPKDLVNKKLLIPSKEYDAEIFSLLQKENIDFNKVDRIYETFDPKDLLDGVIDAATIKTNFHMNYFKELGIRTNFITLSSYGESFYDNILFTNSEKLFHKEKTNKIIIASIQGWEYAFHNIDESVKILNSLNKESEYPEGQINLTNVLHKLKYTVLSNRNKIGSINPLVIASISNTYIDMEANIRTVSLDDFIYNPNPTMTTIRNDNFYLAIGLLSGIVLLIFAFISQLRRMVNKKTKALQNEIEERKKLLEAQKELEKSLIKSQSQSKAILNAIPDIMFRITKEGVHIDCSFPKDSKFAVPRDHIINKTVESLLPPEVSKLEMSSIKKALEENEMQIIKYLLPQPDQTKRYFEARIIPSAKDDVLAIIRDTTDDEIQKELLKISEEKFSLLFKSSPSAIIMTSLKEGIIIDVNKKFEEVLGYKATKINGKSIIDLGIWETHEIRNGYFSKLLTKKSIKNLEINFRDKNKILIPGLISSELIEIMGEKFVITNFVDLRSIKENEQKLRESLAEVKSLKNQLEDENIYLKEEINLEHNFNKIITNSPKYKEILRKIEHVAPTSATVLILGETGTGKELLARSVHEISERADKPLVKVNCASLPENLIESELFGHEKGAFTGAINQKIGRFELAHKGTIFLDEIGDLPFKLQAKLLRVLQENEFERIGSTKTMKVDVRIIAATNRDLQSLVNIRKFRDDLFFRLNVFPIITIPLRERTEDITSLVNYFVKEFSKKLGKTITSIPQYTLKSFLQYSWPGNIRELENIIERAVILSSDSTLRIDRI